MWDVIRHWLMGLIAGKKFAYWISDRAQKDIESLGVAGGGAAICLVKAMDETGATRAEYELSGYTISVIKKEQSNG